MSWNMLSSGQNGAKLRRMLDDMRKIEEQCGMDPIREKLRKSHEAKPSYARVHRYDVDPIYRAGVDFRRSYMFKMLSSGYTREVKNEPSNSG